MDAVTQPERTLESAAERWARFTPIHTGEDYLNSLRGRPLRLFLFGKEEPNPVDNPLIRPSMNAEESRSMGRTPLTCRENSTSGITILMLSLVVRTMETAR